MKILQINTSDTKGGAGKVAYRLHKEFENKGHWSRYLVSKKYSKNKNVLLTRPYNNLRQRILKKLTYYLANDIDLFRTNHILKMKEFQEADLIHCHNLHSNYFNLGILHKISALKPVVWTLHDMWPITAHCAHSFDGAMKESGFFTCPSLDIYPPIAWHNEKYLEKSKKDIYDRSNFNIVTPSQWLADKVNQSILKDKPITVIHNGIDTNIFKPSDKNKTREELGLTQDKKIILILAKRIQSNPWKGGDYFQNIIKTYENDDKVYFINIGGDENNTSRNMKNISFVTSEAELAKYYSAADVLLYPSIADNCPLVVLEASACGLPVVAFNTGGIPELVEHKKTGYIAEYKNSKDLARGIKYMLDLDVHSLNQMSHAATQKVSQNFTLEIMTQQYLNLYSLVSKKPV
jgi:glycosyltransferase involved in cell wall biosynthesis